MAISAGTKGFRPTEAQAQAIEKISVPMAVDAAAGSGKTAVLIRRILNIVGGDWARLEHVLAISFTEKTAGELRAKLRIHVPPAERFRLDASWIGTFHSFCARLLRRHAPQAGLDPAFVLLDENASGMHARKCVRETLLDLLQRDDAAARDLVEEVGFATAVGALEELMQFRWHAARALTEREGAEGWERTALAALGTVFSAVRESYLTRLAELCALDFQELEIRALELLEKKSVADASRAMFAHILVDEYQDTNDIQTELVLKLFDPKVNRLFIVGDEAQSIYRFRGANVSCFARVREEIETRRGETVRLSKNFRSMRPIVSFINLSQEVLAEGLFSDPSSPKPMLAHHGDGRGAPVVELSIPPAGGDSSDMRRAREAEAIARMIADKSRAREWSYGDAVLLFRAMTSVDIYESALRRHSIPCSSIGGRGLLKRSEVADLMAALRYANDEGDAVALLTLLRSPIGGLSDDELALMAGEDGRGLPSAVAKDERLALIGELPAMAAHMRPSEILRRVINDAGLELLWAGLDRSGGANMNMDRLVTIARDLEREVPTTLFDFNSYMSEMRERGAKLGDVPPGASPAGAVRLMTVHAAKGLEFPVVFLPDLIRRKPANTKQWIFSRGDGGGGAGVAFRKRDPEKPFGSRIATERFTALANEESSREARESKRLLYVAMTRAIDTLVLPTHEGAKEKDSWHAWVGEALASRGGTEIAKRITPKPSRPGEGAAEKLADVDAFSPRARHAGGNALRLSVTQLDSYSVCPMQYYLKYVLGLPASEVTRDEPDRIEPNVYGSIVHAMLARATTDEEELRAAARSECLSQGVSAGDTMMKELLNDATQAIELAGKDGLDKGPRELPFEIRAGLSTISGTIDWLKPVGGGHEIIDYKTGTKDVARARARAEQYEMQMQAYALAAEAITGERVRATRLIFPAAGEVVTREMGLKRRQEAGRNIERIVTGIEAREYGIKAKPPCEGCVYHRNGMCWEDRTKRKRKRRT